MDFLITHRDDIEYSAENLQLLMRILSSGFNVITSFETIEHLKNPMVFLRQVKNLLEDEGLLILSTFNEKVIG
ncbi:class I SAM-dependent methyltransferase [Priestia flexa]|uniref:class I SAM-dependent methyltransferase n=1 Tax=Priestia flexa TaxID=86664 RepID=UPI001CD3759A|nr:class I SAM-dependent methyltransferase [Priestia flexa]